MSKEVEVVVYELAFYLMVLLCLWLDKGVEASTRLE